MQAGGNPGLVPQRFDYLEALLVQPDRLPIVALEILQVPQVMQAAGDPGLVPQRFSYLEALLVQPDRLPLVAFGLL